MVCAVDIALPLLPKRVLSLGWVRFSEPALPDDITAPLAKGDDPYDGGSGMADDAQVKLTALRVIWPSLQQAGRFRGFRTWLHEGSFE
jgi:hypothetical protein